jgi:hypothetical protein
MWRWRKIEEISWADFVRNAVLHTIKDRNILCAINKRKAD